MEDQRPKPLIERIETIKPKSNKSMIIIIIGLIVLLIVAGGYIATEKIDICETAKNDSLMLGQQQGTLFWNSVVIQTINEQQEIPYIVNNTMQRIPVSQLCSGVQDGE